MFTVLSIGKIQLASCEQLIRKNINILGSLKYGVLNCSVQKFLIHHLDRILRKFDLNGVDHLSGSVYRWLHFGDLFVSTSKIPLQ